MSLDPFWNNIFSRRDRAGDELYEILARVPIFQDLSRREFQRIRGILHRRSYGVDEAIVREGDVGVGMYVILSGEVAILQEGTDGGMIELACFGSGDFFGDQVLLDESARTASAITREPTRAIGFFRPDLLELIEHDPRLGLKIVMRLSHMISVRLRQTNRLLKETREQARRAVADAAAADLANRDDESGAGDSPDDTDADS
jgi:CRP/FNR family transcriptional regulator, cyclic AMP receptor protein